MNFVEHLVGYLREQLLFDNLAYCNHGLHGVRQGSLGSGEDISEVLEWVDLVKPNLAKKIL